MNDGVYIFSCGTQFADWQEANCFRCTKYDYENPGARCDLDMALLEAQVGDGTVSAEIARRLGYEEGSPPRYCWQCGEVEWTEAWRAEYPLRMATKAERGRVRLLLRRHNDLLWDLWLARDNYHDEEEREPNFRECRRLNRRIRYCRRKLNRAKRRLQCRLKTMKGGERDEEECG